MVSMISITMKNYYMLPLQLIPDPHPLENVDHFEFHVME